MGDAHRDAAGVAGADGGSLSAAEISAEEISEIGAVIAVAKGHGGGGGGGAAPRVPSDDAVVEISISISISEVELSCSLSCRADGAVPPPVPQLLTVLGSVLEKEGAAAHAPGGSTGVGSSVGLSVAAWVAARLAACMDGTAGLPAAAAGRSSARTAHRRTA